MASENKKRKAKNSYILNGAESHKDIKMKRTFYFTKADRVKNNKIDDSICTYDNCEKEENNNN